MAAPVNQDTALGMMSSLMMVPISWSASRASCRASISSSSISSPSSGTSGGEKKLKKESTRSILVCGLAPGLVPFFLSTFTVGSLPAAQAMAVPLLATRYD